MDVRLDAGVDFALPVPDGHSAFVYVYEGALSIGVSREAATINAQELAVLGDGTEVRLSGRAPRTRAILVAGRPLKEPVARYGPFVMNTREELHQAFADYQAGKF
jgi:redox-sensitive bicupin YhaK (pirin superfamily)